MKINPKARHDDAVIAAPGKMFGEFKPEDAYHTCEVAFWSNVEPVCNYAASEGFRLHTMRDGIRGHGSMVSDFGYRLVFERSA